MLTGTHEVTVKQGRTTSSKPMRNFSRGGEYYLYVDCLSKIVRAWKLNYYAYNDIVTSFLSIICIIVSDLIKSKNV